MGKPGVIAEADPSPDGHYALIVESHHPYSYELPFENFPKKTEVVDLRTGAVKQLSDVPLADNIPIANDAVATGPRDYEWRSDAPASLSWVEAGDGGDPKNAAAVRDRVYLLDAPFTGAPRLLAELPMRVTGIEWGNAHLALVNEREWNHRRRVIAEVDPSASAPSVTKLYEGSSENRYQDPGRAVMVENAAGHWVLDLTADGTGIYFTSMGASAEGDRPFVAVMNAASGPNPGKEEADLAVGCAVLRGADGGDRSGEVGFTGAARVAGAAAELLSARWRGEADAGDGVSESRMGTRRCRRNRFCGTSAPTGWS